MRKPIIVLGIVLAVLVSCNKRETGNSTNSTAMLQQGGLARSADAFKAGSPPATEEATAAMVNAAPPPPPKSLPSQRMIVRTASLTLIVGDTARAMQAAAAAAARMGGYVVSSRQWRENDQLRGNVTLRVPSDHFDEMTGTAKKSAVRVQSETVSGEDVTEEFSDLSAHLRNAEAAEVELRELLTSVRQRSQKADDVLEVYDKLREVRAEIEQIKGRLQYLSQVSAMSTVTLDLIPDVLAQPVVEPGWRPAAIAHRAGHSLIESLKWMAGVAIWICIYLLPIGLLCAFVMLVLFRIARGAGRMIWRQRSAAPAVGPI